jgi:hypothetical protein
MLASTIKIFALAGISAAMVARAEPPADGGIPAAKAGTVQSDVGAALAAPGQTLVPAPDADPNGVAAAASADGIDFTAPVLTGPAGSADVLAAGMTRGENLGTTIPKLPAYTVTGTKVAVFRERDINTKDGMAAVSFKRHPGLYFGNAFNLNARAAHEIFLADDWRSTKGDYSDMAYAFAYGGDPGEGRAILQAVKDEDMEMRAEGDSDSGLPGFDRLQIGHLGDDSRLLQAPERPVDFSFVRVKW